MKMPLTEEKMTPKQKALLSLMIKYDTPHFLAGDGDKLISYDGTRYSDLFYVKQRLQTLYKQHYVAPKYYSEMISAITEVAKEL